MSNELFEIRPRFKKITPDSSEELMNQLDELFKTQKTKINGSRLNQHVTIKIPDDQLHFWSPQLSLTIEQKEEGTIVRGLYGPHPNVWLLFMFIYFFLGFIVLVVLIVGLSRLNLGLHAYILWSIPFALSGIFVLWFIGKSGKKLGHDQIWQIHNLLKPTILKNAKDYDDW